MIDSKRTLQLSHAPALLAPQRPARSRVVGGGKILHIFDGGKILHIDDPGVSISMSVSAGQVARVRAQASQPEWLHYARTE